ncbi:MAG: GNAT family N-acetyltransferase [Oscillospiraceae bacterium]|jgi:ribosomal-protein-alanine N-acetyltransferase|nr:GNAT family N-acetyltransferase [Oscillospiraceae bacterium]
MNHKGTVTLETERLVLRRFKADDTDAMFRNWAVKNSDIAKYLEWNGSTFITIENWIASYEKPNSYNWAIVLKEAGEPIGYINAHDIDDLRNMLEIGYAIGESFWHKGIVTEAARRIVAFFFEDVKVNRIAAKHNSINPRSGGVMLSIGMSFEGTLRQASQTGCDVHCYSILASEYQESKDDPFAKPRKNNIILSGVPRAGKTTLCRMLMRYGYTHISMDAIIAGFEQHYPDLGINTYQDLSSLNTMRVISKKIAPFIRAMIESEYSGYEGERAAFDVYQLLPEDYATHLASLNCTAHWLGSSDCTPGERYDVLKANDTELHYTFYKSEAELREGCGYIVEQSRLLKQQCVTYGLPYSDTTYNREIVFNSILSDFVRRR